MRPSAHDTPLPFTLLAITDRASGTTDLDALATMGGALLFRDKGEDPAERAELGRALRAATSALAIPLIVHGDELLARSLEAEGLHFPSSVPPRPVRGLIVGSSCHDADELARAVAAGIDYVTLSPVRPSKGKGQALGWEGFANLAASCPLPVFALGGVGPHDLEEARPYGAWGIAGIRGFLS